MIVNLSQTHQGDSTELRFFTVAGMGRHETTRRVRRGFVQRETWECGVYDSVNR
jgi:hypothetical protein